MTNTSKNLIEEIIDNAVSPTNISLIKPDMAVVCSQGGEFATVDHLQGSEFIKLKKDDAGRHHYIPVAWVTKIEDGKVFVDRPGDQAMKEWTELPE